MGRNILEKYYNCAELNMILELTKACNLKCKYCFENCQTEQRDDRKMSKGTMRKSIDFLLKHRRNCHLTFFGGEPTLCKDLLKYGIEYGNSIAKEKKQYISYTIVTNGTILDDDLIDILDRNNVNIIFSFDGDKVGQDNYRPFLNGEGSYDIAYNNLLKLLSVRKDERYGHLIVRPTITTGTISALNGIYNKLRKIGCREISFSLVSAERKAEYAIKESDMEKVISAYSENANIYYDELKNGVSYNKFFEGILRKIDEDIIRKEFCDCGKRYIAIGVDGEIYPCEGFLGIKDFKIGNIHEAEMENQWISPQSVEENSVCSHCWAKYLCGGSCYHEAWMRTGEINKRDQLVCKTYKAAFESALDIYAKLIEDGIKVSSIVGESLLPERALVHINEGNMKRITEGKIYTGNGVSHRVITLNQVADRILELCNGKNRVADIAKIIQEEYDSSYDVYRDISDTISMFLAEEIVYLSV